MATVKKIAIEDALLGAMLKQCPVTSGRPMRTTELGFKRACAQKRKELAESRRGKKGKYKKYCDVCEGKQVPAEVEFVSLDALILEAEKKETVMGVKKRIGTCEQCGKMGTQLYSHLGKQCCAMCKNMRTTVKKKPEAVVDAMKELHGDTYLAGDKSRWTDGYVTSLEEHQSILQAIVEYLYPAEMPTQESFWELVDNALQIIQGLDMAYITEKELREKTGLFRIDGVDAVQFTDGLNRAHDIERRNNAILENQLDGIRQALGLPEQVCNGEVIGKVRGLVDDLEEAQSALGEICAHVGMATEQYGEVIDAVANLSNALQRHKNNNSDLTTSNGLLQDLVDEKTKQVGELERLLKKEGAAEPFELSETLLPFPAMSINSFDLLHDLLWLLKGMVITGNTNGPGQQHVDALEEIVGTGVVFGEAA